MLFYPSITLVDNESDQLEELRNAFSAAGIPCLPILYDEIDGLKVTPPPSAGGSRVIFLDLNLVSTADQKPEILVGPISKALEILSPPGAYLVIFWSKHPDYVEKVMELLGERESFSHIRHPISYSTISKHEFIGNPKGLAEKITKIIRHNDLFNVIIDIENLLVGSALSTSSELYNLAEQHQGQETNSTMADLFTTIAHMAVGKDNATTDPVKAVVDGLTPLVTDHLLKMGETGDLASILYRGLPGLINNTPNLPDQLKAQLNSNFHIDTCTPTNNYTQGAFRQIKEKYLNPGGKFGGVLETFFDSFVNKNKKISGMNKEDSLQYFKEQSIVGLLEISPDCDHAQQNIAFHRFVAGILVPANVARDLKQNSGHRPHIYKFPALWYDDKEHYFALNHRYQVGLTSECRYLNSVVLFRVREQILHEVSFQAAQYTSRPGIIQFE